MCVGEEDGVPVEKVRGLVLGMAAGKAVAVGSFSQGQFVAKFWSISLSV